MQIARHLDQLSIRCRGFLVARGIILDPASYGYSTLVLCREICTFMQNEGFTKPCGNIHSYNKFVGLTSSQRNRIR